MNTNDVFDPEREARIKKIVDAYHDPTTPKYNKPGRKKKRFPPPLPLPIAPTPVPGPKLRPQKYDTEDLRYAKAFSNAPRTRPYTTESTRTLRTALEYEVVHAMASGEHFDEIAHRLKFSNSRVNMIVARLRERLDVSTNPHLIAVLFREGQLK